MYVCFCVYSPCPLYLCSSSRLSLPEELCSCQSVPRCHKVGVLCADSRASHLICVPSLSAPEGFLRRRLTVQALPSQTLRRLPPVPAVAPTDGAVVHLHFNASWDDRRSSEAIWTVFTDGAALFWLVHWIDALWYCTVSDHTVHLVIWLTATPFTGRRLELLQDLIRLPSVFTEVFDLLAFGATTVVFHLGALGVYFRALGLVTDRSVLRAHARAVRVAREEAFPELVHEATVIHAAFPSVVIENDVIVGSSLGLVRGGIVLRADRGRRDSGVQGEQHDANRREKRAHPSPRLS